MSRLFAKVTDICMLWLEGVKKNPDRIYLSAGRHDTWFLLLFIWAKKLLFGVNYNYSGHTSQSISHSQCSVSNNNVPIHEPERSSHCSPLLAVKLCSDSN